MSFSPALRKLNLMAYRDKTFKTKIGEQQVPINPESYSQNYQILYNKKQAQGSSGGSPDYNQTPSQSVKFELVFDGTGVIPTSIPGVVPFTEDGIAAQLKSFLNLVFTFNGDIHSPNYLILSWATLIFRCRLETLDMKYTLFKPDGTPLRARANCNFVSYVDETTLALTSKKKSPDLSRAVTVKAGDTLPLLCYSIYGSSVYYLEVAQANGLADVRRLVPGMQLLFPPLQDSAA